MQPGKCTDQAAVDAYYTRPTSGKNKGQAPGKLVVTTTNNEKHLTFIPKNKWTEPKNRFERLLTFLGFSQKYSTNVQDMAEACKGKKIFHERLANKMDRYNKWHHFGKISSTTILILGGAQKKNIDIFKQSILCEGKIKDDPIYIEKGNTTYRNLSIDENGQIIKTKANDGLQVTNFRIRASNANRASDETNAHEIRAQDCFVLR